MFIVLLLSAIIGMEFFSYAIHRWLFHGILWRIHRTHHVTRKGSFEFNDVFTLFFSAASILLITFSASPLAASTAFPVGIGITIYGILYFVAHDFFTHRRFLPFSSRNTVLLAVRAAHQRHHQKITKDAIEPFGLFIFNYKEFAKKPDKS